MLHSIQKFTERASEVHVHLVQFNRLLLIVRLQRCRQSIRSESKIAWQVGCQRWGSMQGNKMRMPRCGAEEEYMGRTGPESVLHSELRAAVDAAAVELGLDHAEYTLVSSRALQAAGGVRHRGATNPLQHTWHLGMAARGMVARMLCAGPWNLSAWRRRAGEPGEDTPAQCVGERGKTRGRLFCGAEARPRLDDAGPLAAETSACAHFVGPA